MGEKHLTDESEIPLRLLSNHEKPLEVHRLLHGELDQPAQLEKPCLPAKIAADQRLGDMSRRSSPGGIANWLAVQITIRSRPG